MSLIAQVVLKLLTPKHMLTKCIKGFDSENSQCVNQVWSGCAIALTDEKVKQISLKAILYDIERKIFFVIQPWWVISAFP